MDGHSGNVFDFALRAFSRIGSFCIYRLEGISFQSVLRMLLAIDSKPRAVGDPLTACALSADAMQRLPARSAAMIALSLPSWTDLAIL